MTYKEFQSELEFLYLKHPQAPLVVDLMRLKEEDNHLFLLLFIYLVDHLGDNKEIVITREPSLEGLVKKQPRVIFVSDTGLTYKRFKRKNPPSLRVILLERGITLERERR